MVRIGWRSQEPDRMKTDRLGLDQRGAGRPLGPIFLFIVIWIFLGVNVRCSVVVRTDIPINSNRNTFGSQCQMFSQWAFKYLSILVNPLSGLVYRVLSKHICIDWGLLFWNILSCSLLTQSLSLSLLLCVLLSIFCCSAEPAVFAHNASARNLLHLFYQ